MALSPERQSARMLEIKAGIGQAFMVQNIRSETIWWHWALKGYSWWRQLIYNNVMT